MIAKCAGKDCPQRDTCLRYTAPASERQSWSDFDARRFVQEVIGSRLECDGYWPIKVRAS